jgi:transcriptional regulator GlxA family with amidase domain
LDAGGVDALADRLGVGSRHLARLFVKHVGASPLQVATTARLQRAKRLLDTTQLPMLDVALGSGFGSVRRFNAVFRATYGRSPTELRQKRPRRP